MVNYQALGRMLELAQELKWMPEMIKVTKI